MGRYSKPVTTVDGSSQTRWPWPLDVRSVATPSASSSLRGNPSSTLSLVDSLIERNVYTAMLPTARAEPTRPFALMRASNATAPTSKTKHVLTCPRRTWARAPISPKIAVALHVAQNAAAAESAMKLTHLHVLMRYHNIHVIA